MQKKVRSRVGLGVLCSCAVFSGAAGLIYQVAWSKALGLLFGYSAYAVATSLTVFLGGLALGSAWFSSRRATADNLVTLYAKLEAAIAISGALSLLGLAVVRTAYLALYPRTSGLGGLVLVLRILSSATVLLVPTFFMGGTFPVLVRGTSMIGHGLPTRVAQIYALNTLGAVAGALLAGFLLLPQIGLHATVGSAVALNVIAGTLAVYVVWLLRSDKPDTTRVSDTRKESRSTTQAAPLLLAAFTLVGATAIAYEICWTRLLATVLGSSTYAFTLLLATFLAGITLGSLLFQRVSGRITPTVRAFSLTQTALALTVLAFLVSYRSLPPLIPQLLRATGGSFNGLTLGQGLVSALAILPTAILFGFNFPLVVLLIESSEDGLSVGRAYAANTVGAIVAALVVGFVLLPAIGGYRLIAATAGVNALLAAALALSAKRDIPLAALNAVLIGALAWIGTSSHFFQPATATFSPVLYGSLPGSHLSSQEIADTEDVVFLEEGLNATIAVTRTEGYLSLKTNGKVDASTSDVTTQLLLGDLGAVFHPHPRRALVIGFGGGMTVSALSRFPDVELIDCVEIEPAVLHAAPWLTRLHHGVLEDPRVHLIVDDARNLVQASLQSYDLIVSEPSNPWIAGIASLFTYEFYQAVRQRLAPGGMLVQWVQAYSLAPEDFRMILATIAPHFEDLSLWHNDRVDFLILARTEKRPLDFERSRALFGNPSLAQNFRTLHLVGPESWLAYLRLGDGEVRSLARGAPINTDNLTLLEYRAPRTLLNVDLTNRLSELVREHQREVLGSEVAGPDLRVELLAAASTQIETKSSWTWHTLQALSNEPPTQVLEILRGRMDLLWHRPEQALQHFQNARRAAGELLAIQYWSGMAKWALGEADQANALFNEVIQRDPGNVEALQALVQLAREKLDWSAAIVAQQQLLLHRQEPSANDYCQLGELQLRTGQWQSAESTFRQGLLIEPYSFLCHRELGELLRVTNRTAEARVNLQFVARYFPSADPKTYLSLALLHQSDGRLHEAEEILRKGRRIFPGDRQLLEFHLTRP